MATDTLDSTQRYLKKSLSYLPESPNDVVLQLTLMKEKKERWGISVVGGANSTSGNIYIKEISRDSISECDGQLKVGDRILEVNGENVMNKSHEETVDIFRRNQTELNLVVSRLTSSKSKTNGSVICTFESSAEKCFFSNVLDEESVVMEHKSLPTPKNYSSNMW